MKQHAHLILLVFFLLLTGSGCSQQEDKPAADNTALVSMHTLQFTLTSNSAESDTFTRTPIRTITPAPSYTPWPTRQYPTATSTITPTPTITPSPTFTFPRITAIMQANCRYGPGTAYLYAHGMYPGDGGAVWGRNSSGTWLWIQPDNIAYQCWISTSVVEVQGDIFTVFVAQVRLPYCDLYGPPENIVAIRDGDEVIVTWSRVPMTLDDDRGYLLEVTVCQDGHLAWMAVHTDDVTYTFTDELGCDGDSGGLLYTVDKHGYSDPVQIPWP